MVGTEKPDNRKVTTCRLLKFVFKTTAKGLNDGRIIGLFRIVLCFLFSRPKSDIILAPWDVSEYNLIFTPDCCCLVQDRSSRKVSDSCFFFFFFNSSKLGLGVAVLPP